MDRRRPNGDHIHGDRAADLLWSDPGDDAVQGNEGWDWYKCLGVNCGLEGMGGNDNVRGGNGTSMATKDGNHDHCNGGGGSGDVPKNCHKHGGFP